jgi:glycerol-3-phosphate acyltransferase PlsY
LQEGTQALVGLAAFLGHLYPVFFRFVGGKGVATALGVVVATNPWLGLATLASWLIVVSFSRYVSLASVVAAVFVPVYYLFAGVLPVWRGCCVGDGRQRLGVPCAHGGFAGVAPQR